jgi:ATP-binding cassette subfamily B multidrug efflux pump
LSDNRNRKQQHRFTYEDDEVMEKPFDYGTLKRLLGYLKPYTRTILPGVIMMTILGAMAKLSIPFLIGYAIDHAISNKSTDHLLLLVGIMVAVFIVQWIANTYRIRWTNVMGQQVIYDLRSALFKHIQQLSFRFFDKRPAGSVLVRITNDVNSLQDLLTNGVVNLLIDCIQLTGIVIILLLLNFKLGAAIMITVPIMFIISQALRKRIRRAWQDVRMKQSRLNAHLNESIQGIRVTQAYTQEKENIHYFDGMNYGNKKSWDKASALNQSLGPMIEVTSALGMCILFWYGTHLIQIDPSITIGMLVTFSGYMGNFWEPINRLGQMYSQLLIAMASSERIFEFMDETPSVSEVKGAEKLPPIKGDVRLENIRFEYEPGRPALKKIDLNVEAGQAIALVGHTGSGKSTIINLICRFYDPVKGKVIIDGKDIKDVTIESLRTQVGIVMQDTFIFSGSIRDNIRFGRLDASDYEVEKAAKSVNAHDFISSLPNGYETQVEERGNVLSMGQKQLISFARALLADPRILILDEATASIDTETELKIQDALKTLLSGRTSFIVAHRLSTIRHADKIVVLDHGVIKEIGSHDELMNAEGIYSGLIEAQYRFLDDAV